MKKKGGILLFALLFIFLGNVTHAQEAIEIGKMLSKDKDITVRDISKINDAIVISDTLEGWDYQWIGGLNGSQAAYNNWSQGGVNTVSVTASTIFNLFHRKNRFGYALATNFKYGQARIDNEGTRKTDDKIAINNKFSYLFTDKRWSAFANINFATQFDKGFNYDVDDDQDPILLSDFFAPAYFTQIAGVAFSPAEYFSAEAGMAFKETIVNNDDLSLRYGLDGGENYRFEPGYSFALNFEKNIVSNVTLTSTFETFTNLQRNVESTDVSFTNEIIGKINSYLNTSFQFVMIYDDDFSKEVQLKQVLSVGFSYSIL